jgi:hypothetical protein
MELTPLGETFPILGSGLHRAEGCHLTDITRYVMDTIDPITTKFDNPQLTMEMGFIWEDLLSLVLGNRLGKRISDVQRNGIYLNPDGLGADPLIRHSLAVEEYKCTWRSVNRLPTENIRWMMQVKAYCHALGIPVAVMHNLHVNGNYKGSGPLPVSYRIEFTNQELKDNWAVILDNKDAAMEAKAKEEQD